MREYREIQPVTLADMKTMFTSIEEVIAARVTSAISNALHKDSWFSDIYNTLTQATTYDIVQQGEHHSGCLSTTSALSDPATTLSPPTGQNTGIPPGLYISNIPHTTPPQERWKLYVQQWDSGDSHCIKQWDSGDGHCIMLKD